jgi:Flp pilus assembly pilin Flp
MHNIIERLRAAFHDENGQALTEYAILISVTTGVLFLFFRLFTGALGQYYTNVAQYVSLPFP